MQHQNKQQQKYTSIPLVVLVYLAWQSLSSKKLRSGLTIAGISVGIGAIFFLFSLGLGLQNLVTGEVIGNQSVQSIDVQTPNSRILSLDEDALDSMRSFDGVESVSGVYTFAGGVTVDGSETDVVVYGIDQQYQELTDLSLVAGRNLTAEDTNSVIINTASLEAIGISEDQKSVINREIQAIIPISNDDATASEINQSFTIVGIIDSGAGSELFIPASNFSDINVQNYSGAKILAADIEVIPTIRQQIESQGFETVAPVDTLEQINQIFVYFNLILVGFGAIGMVVAVLGMFNTLTISLLERTREIGLMIILGGRHKDMRYLFIIEAALLSLLGSFFGMFLAVLAGKGVDVIMNGLARGRSVSESFSLFSTPLWLFVALLCFMLLVSLLVVLLPARRAARISPIDTLRRE